MAINYVLQNWPLFPEITDILEYSERMGQLGGPIDRSMMRAVATEFNLDLSIYVDGYVVRINGPENTANTNVDLFFAEEEYMLLGDVFREETLFEGGNDVLVDIDNVLARVLEEDDAMSLRTMVNAGIINPYAVDANGNNILRLAVMGGATDIVGSLINEFAFVNGVFQIILEEDNFTLLEAMVNARIINPNQIDANGNNLLHLAVMADATEIAASLIYQWDFNREYINNEGEIAAVYASFPVMDYVLSNLTMAEVLVNWGVPFPAEVVQDGAGLRLGGEFGYSDNVVADHA